MSNTEAKLGVTLTDLPPIQWNPHHSQQVFLEGNGMIVKPGMLCYCATTNQRNQRPFNYFIVSSVNYSPQNNKEIGSINVIYPRLEINWELTPFYLDISLKKQVITGDTVISFGRDKLTEKLQGCGCQCVNCMKCINKQYFKSFLPVCHYNLTKDTFNYVDQEYIYKTKELKENPSTHAWVWCTKNQMIDILEKAGDISYQDV